MCEASRFLGGFTIFGSVGLNAYNTPIYSSHRSQHAMHIHLSYTRHSFLSQTAIKILMTWSLFSTYNTIYIFFYVCIFINCVHIFLRKTKSCRSYLINHCRCRPPLSYFWQAIVINLFFFFISIFFSSVCVLPSQD